MAEAEKPIRLYDTYTSGVFRIEAVGLSWKGGKRPLNQDRFIVKGLKEGIVAAVADGMGGEPFGEKASALAVSTINSSAEISKDRENSLVTVFHDIDRQILATSKTNPEFENMGTTLTAMHIHGAYAYWSHVGDTRIYLSRGKQLIQITSDHTFAKFLLDEGEITPEQAKTHYSQHILEQCIGHGECSPQTGTFMIRDNDLVLMSTDGVHNVLDDATITMALGRDTQLTAMGESLAQDALAAGGTDDMTLILFRISARD